MIAGQFGEKNKRERKKRESKEWQQHRGRTSNTGLAVNLLLLLKGRSGMLEKVLL
jgi:hypothetical protein